MMMGRIKNKNLNKTQQQNTTTKHNNAKKKMSLINRHNNNNKSLIVPFFRPIDICKCTWRFRLTS